MLPPTSPLKNQTWKMRQMMKLMQRSLTPEEEEEEEQEEEEQEEEEQEQEHEHEQEQEQEQELIMTVGSVGPPNDVIFRERVCNA